MLPLLLPELEGVCRRLPPVKLTMLGLCATASEVGEKIAVENMLSQGLVGSDSDDATEFAVEIVAEGVGSRLEEPEGKVRGNADWKSLGCRGDFGGGGVGLGGDMS